MLGVAAERVTAATVWQRAARVGGAGLPRQARGVGKRRGHPV